MTGIFSRLLAICLVVWPGYGDQSKYLFIFSLFFHLWSFRIAKSTRIHVLFMFSFSFFFFFFFFFVNNHSVWSSGWDYIICLYLKISDISRISFSQTVSGFRIYHLVQWSNFNILHNYQWFTFPTQSCLVLCSFCVSLHHSLILWLIVSSFSSHWLFCCV